MTPGLLNVEARGDFIIALSSKCHVVGSSTVDGGIKYEKISAKGIQQQRNLELLTRDSFWEALFGDGGPTTTNFGFVNRRPDGMITYLLRTQRLSALYVRHSTA